MENIVFKPHKVARKDRAAHVHVDNGDKIILKVYKRVLPVRYNLKAGSGSYTEQIGKIFIGAT